MDRRAVQAQQFAGLPVGQIAMTLPKAGRISVSIAWHFKDQDGDCNRFGKVTSDDGGF